MRETGAGQVARKEDGAALARLLPWLEGMGGILLAYSALFGDNALGLRVASAVLAAALLGLSWESFTSIKLAVGMLLMLGFLTLVANLFPQPTAVGQPEQAMPAYYAEKFGDTTFTYLLIKLGLPNLFHSFWYRAAMLAMSMCVFSCACKAWSRAARRYTFPPIPTTAERVLRMRHHEQASVDLAPAEALLHCKHSLENLGYVVADNETRDGSKCLVGRRWAWSVWGSPLMHFSVLAIVVAGVLSSRPELSYSLTYNIPEGSTWHGERPGMPGGHPELESRLPKKLFDFDLTVADFALVYHGNGSIKEYVSDLIVSRRGRQLARQKIQVNHPLKFAGIRFFQNSWGIQAVVVQVTGPDGKREELTLPLVPSQEPSLGSDDVPQYDLGGQPPRMSSTGWILMPVAWQLHDGRRVGTGFWQDFVVFRADKAADKVHPMRELVEPERNDDQVQDLPVSTSEFPHNPALNLFLITDAKKALATMAPDSIHRLGMITRTVSKTYQGYRFRILGTREYTGLEARKDFGRPLYYPAFVIVILAMMVTLYLSPRTVRAHFTGADHRTDVTIGGTARFGGGFDREFRRLADSLGIRLSSN